jgi:hypothetical protein
LHARIRSTFALALLTLCAAVPAQQKPQAVPQPAPQVEAKPAATADASRDAALDREIEAMREKVKEGKAFRSHVRVTVRLNNGNRVQGIVKDGFVVERKKVGDAAGVAHISAGANGHAVRPHRGHGHRVTTQAACTAGVVGIEGQHTGQRGRLFVIWKLVDVGGSGLGIGH